MTNALGKSDLLADLKSKATALGLSLHEDGKVGLSGEIESIRAKWFLGSRKAIYRMSCRLAEAEHTMLFREAVIEKSWGPAATDLYRREDDDHWLEAIWSAH